MASNNNNSGRFLVGGQAGVNWQINNFVLGIEGDGDVAIGGNNNFPGFLNPRTNTGFFATVRGRGGIAFDRLLVYGTGGVAFGARRDFGNTFIGTTFGGRRSSRLTLSATRLSAILSVQVLNTPSSTIGASRPSTSSPISAATDGPSSVHSRARA